MTKALVGGAALLVIVAAGLWLRREHAPSTPPAVVERRVAPAVPRPSATPEDAAPAPAALEPASAPLPVDDGTAALARTMAERWQALAGRDFVAHLVEQGLARTDAEPIVAALAREVVRCGFDAMRAQALAQQVPFDDVLNALEAQLHDADGPPLTTVLDMRAVAQQELQCSLTALEGSGISPQAATQMLQEAINARSSRRTAPR